MDTPIITSLLWLDYYKKTMAQRSFLFHKKVRVESTFINRSLQFRLAELMNLDELREQLEYVRTLKFTEGDIEYLRQQGIFKEEFLAYLAKVQLPEFDLRARNGQVLFRVENNWVPESLWETIFLAIQATLTNKGIYESHGFTEATIWARAEERMCEIIRQLKTRPWIRIIEFSTRRPLSTKWHQHFLEMLLNEIPDMIAGTSNIYLARHFGIPPKGTDAHESFQVLAGVYDATDYGLRASVQIERREMELLYGAENIIDLTDTFGSRSYIEDMEEYQVITHRGSRVDSMDPIEYAKLWLPVYKKYGVDSTTKVLLPSDNLDVEKIFTIDDALNNLFTLLFGWGGGLGSNTGLPKPNTVLKATKANGRRLVKLSDTIGKVMGDPAPVQRYVRVFKPRD